MTACWTFSKLIVAFSEEITDVSCIPWYVHLNATDWSEKNCSQKFNQRNLIPTNAYRSVKTETIGKEISEHKFVILKFLHIFSISVWYLKICLIPVTRCLNIKKSLHLHSTFFSDIFKCSTDIKASLLRCSLRLRIIVISIIPLTYICHCIVFTQNQWHINAGI